MHRLSEDALVGARLSYLVAFESNADVFFFETGWMFVMFSGISRKFFISYLLAKKRRDEKN